MPEANNDTNTTKVIWFILSTVTLLVISLVGGWAATKNQIDVEVQTQVQELRQDLIRIDMKLDMLLNDRGMNYTLPSPKPKK